MVMMMPPYHGTGLRADEAAICEHFSVVAESISIPIMVQDAPLSGVTLSVNLLARLATALPQVAYFKIEMPNTADKLRSLIAIASDVVAGPFDGEEGITLLADLDAGATGTMPSALIPDLIKPVLEHHVIGDRQNAASDYARVLPVINFENRQCGLRAAKAAMKVGGVIKSDAVRHPLQPLHPATLEALLGLLRPMDPVALRWGH
jgi:4-hydroxy-tetrahydrodipicolinate synthase